MSRPLAVANYNNNISHTDQAWTGEINGFLFNVFANGQLSVASDPLFDFGTGDFTVELTVGQANNDITLIDFRDSTGQDRLRVDLAANDYIKVYKGETLLLTSSVSVPGSYERVLPHVAVTRASGVIKIWIEGVEQGSVSDSTDFTQGPISIAASYNRSTQFDGTFGEVRVSTVARYTSNFTQPTTAHVDDADTSLLLHADGPNFSISIVDDASNAPIAGTRLPASIAFNNNAEVSTAESKFGASSVYLDGAGSTNVTVSNFDQSATSGEFTLDTWVRFPVEPSAMANGFAMWFITVGDTAGRMFGTFSSDPLPSNGAGLAIDVAGERLRWEWSPALNQWYHIALTRNSSNELDVYVDGTALTLGVGNNVYSGDFFTGDLRFGQWNSSTYAPSEYYLDEFRLSSVNRYAANFGAPTAEFVNDNDTAFLFHAEGADGDVSLDDDTALNQTRTPVTVNTGGTANISSVESKFGGSSLYFNNGYLDVTDFDSNFSDGEFTIESWVYLPKPVIDNPNSFVVWFTDTAGSYFGFNSADLDGNFGGSSLNVNGVRTRFDWWPNVVDTWYHVALTRDTSNNFHLWVDGVEKAVGYGPGSGSGTFIKNSKMVWGRWATSNTYAAAEFYIDDIRVSNVNRYPTSFTPPTVAHINDYDTSYLINADSDLNDDTSINTIRERVTVTALSVAQASTEQSKFGTASLKLGYLETNCPLPNTGDWTVDYWARNGSRSATAGHWELVNGSHLFRVYTTTQQGGTIQIVATDETGTLEFSEQTGSFLPDDVWNHVALVRQGNTFSIYDNGVLKKSWTSSVSLPDLGVFKVGRIATLNYRGYIDEFRVSNVARWTSNFSVPTVAYGNDTNTLMLLHMDDTYGNTTFIDDNGTTYDPPGEVKEFSAALSVTSTVSATAKRIRQTNSDLSVISSATITAKRIRSTISDLSVTSTVSASVGKIVQGTVNMTSVFSPSISVNATKVGETALTVSSTMIADVARIRSTSVTLFNIVTLNIQAAKTVDATSNLDSNFVLSAQPNLIRSTTADISTLASLNITPLIVRDFDANLSASFALSATSNSIRDAGATLLCNTDVNAAVQRLRGVNAQFNAVFTASVDVGEIEGGIAADLNATSSMLVTAQVIRGITADLSVNATATSSASYVVGITANLLSKFTVVSNAVGVVYLDEQNLAFTALVDATANQISSANANLTVSTNIVAQATRVKNTGAVLACESNVNAQAQRLRATAASLAVSSSVTSTPNKIAGVMCDLDAQFDVAVSAQRLRDSVTDCVAQFGVDANAVRLVDSQVALDAQFNVNATAGVIAQFNADLNAVFTLTANGRIVVITQIVYVVPRELRNYAITRELTVFNIHQETRTFNIRKIV